MDIQLFRNIIIENQEFIGNIPLVKRGLSTEKNGNYVFVGVRQAGKSYMMYQQIEEILSTNESIERIVYINFDDERLIGMQASSLDLILQAYHSTFDNKPILFFDEIQNVDGWANFVRRLSNQKYQVFVTGSNAKMLGRDIETVLGGRLIGVDVFPYNFKEYLNAINVEIPGKWMFGRAANNIQREFRTFFEWGGFPELIHYKEKRIWLNNLYNRIFFNDIVVRQKVKNEDALRLCVRKLAESVKQPCSLNRLSNIVRSTGLSFSPSTAMEYVRYLQESCLLISIDNFASKISDKETVKKHYFIDNGLLHLFITESDTSLLENLCAIELYKQYKERIYFYNKNIEVDFFIPDDKIAVQACFSIEDSDTFERETAALVKLNSIVKLNKALIISYSDEKMVNVDGLDIEIIPIWKWILNRYIQ